MIHECAMREGLIATTQEGCFGGTGTSSDGVRAVAQDDGVGTEDGSPATDEGSAQEAGSSDGGVRSNSGRAGRAANRRSRAKRIPVPEGLRGRPGKFRGRTAVYINKDGERTTVFHATPMGASWTHPYDVKCGACP